MFRLLHRKHSAFSHWIIGNDLIYDYLFYDTYVFDSEFRNA